MTAQSGRYDIIVIGAGIAGASAAAMLAEHASVAVLEMESQPGYHTTGRSAALFSGGLGGPTVGALSFASGPFLRQPPDGFAEHPLVSQRGVLMIARADQVAALEAFAAGVRPDLDVRRLDGKAARSLNPLLRQDYVRAAVWNPSATDIDVHALHGGFLKLLRARGGEVIVDARVEGLRQTGPDWRVDAAAGVFHAGLIVNAAGAWADQVAQSAGLPPLGLQPLRRTAMLIDPPPASPVSVLPMTIDVDEEFYLKPDAGKFLVSPADETPMPPQDIQPDEFDIALCVERIERAFEISVRRIAHKWAGLRTFAPDRVPVVGCDPLARNFFWLAGQGGFGIQTSPAMARATAALALRQPLPDDLRKAGLDPAAIAPDRFGDRRA